MHDITPETFLQTLFPADLLLPDEMPVVAWPDSFISRETGKEVNYFAQRKWPDRRGTRVAYPFPRNTATYFCVSTVERQRQLQVKKRLEDVRTAMVLVVDDLGTKAKWPEHPFSYVLETSKGNFQGGWLIEPMAVSSPEAQARYDAYLYSLALAGHNDDGCRSASRLMRLPGSVHHTGFVARIVEWAPRLVVDPEELFLQIDIPITVPRVAKALKPGKYASLNDVHDPVYRWLVDRWTVYGHNDQWVHIECPWRSEHTDGAQGGSSTAYSPRDYGRAGVGFKCLHGHCAKRGVDDFLTHVHAEMLA